MYVRRVHTIRSCSLLDSSQFESSSIPLFFWYALPTSHRGGLFLLFFFSSAPASIFTSVRITNRWMSRTSNGCASFDCAKKKVANKIMENCSATTTKATHEEDKPICEHSRQSTADAHQCNHILQTQRANTMKFLIIHIVCICMCVGRVGRHRQPVDWHNSVHTFSWMNSKRDTPLPRLMMIASSHISSTVLSLDFNALACDYSELCNEWNQINCFGIFNSTYSTRRANNQISSRL